jgi:hypothetical protein
MRKIIRAGAVVATAAAIAAVVLPSTIASAAVAGHKHGHDVDGPKPALGQIIICNHSGYVFDVYADGPSIREDDLAGSFDECSDWKPVLAGGYSVGFGLRTASAQNVIIQARYKRDGHVFYKVFNGQGQLPLAVGKDEVTKLDLFIPQA